MTDSPVTVFLQGPELLPDHQEAHRPVSDPQETGQEQHASLLHSPAVCRRRPAHVQELRHVQLRKFVVSTLEFEEEDQEPFYPTFTTTSTQTTQRKTPVQTVILAFCTE